MSGFSDTKEPDRINDLLLKFRDQKEQFDRGIGVQLLGVSAQVLNQVLSAGKSLNSTSIIHPLKIGNATQSNAR